MRDLIHIVALFLVFGFLATRFPREIMRLDDSEGAQLPFASFLVLSPGSSRATSPGFAESAIPEFGSSNDTAGIGASALKRNCAIRISSTSVSQGAIWTRCLNHAKFIRPRPLPRKAARQCRPPPT